MKTKFYILVLSLLITVSCRESSELLSSRFDQVDLKVKVSTNDFEQGEVKLAANRVSSTSQTIADTIIELANYYLKAEFKAKNLNGSTPANPALGKIGQKLAQTTLSPNVWYKLIVYNPNGSFKAERTYQFGNESAGSVLKLDGGVTYTFVAYSLNSTNRGELDALGTSFSTSTLSNSKIIVSDDQDLLFFKTSMLITGDPEEFLNIKFKHKFNELSVVVDASATGYNISALDAYITTPQKDAILSFSDEIITRSSGGVKNSLLTFPTLGTVSVMSNPLVVNTSSGHGMLVIKGITIGPHSVGSALEPLVPFSNISVLPGYGYTINLTIVPQDSIIIHRGQSAIRINGKIWMRHNLRTQGNYSADPDVLNLNVIGDYFQWGRLNHILAGGSGPSAAAELPLSNWSDITNIDANSWNATAGTLVNRENNPSKSAKDPCPSFYRVPTNKEIQFLLDNTVATSTGSGTKNSSNYSYGLLLTSKRNRNVKMTIPSQGSIFANLPPGVAYSSWYDNFAVTTRFWSSYYDNNDGSNISGVITAHLSASNATPNLEVTVAVRTATYSNSGTLSLPIRCIAE